MDEAKTVVENIKIKKANTTSKPKQTEHTNERLEVDYPCTAGIDPTQTRPHPSGRCHGADIASGIPSSFWEPKGDNCSYRNSRRQQ